MKINRKTMRIICAAIIALTVVMSLCNVCMAKALNVTDVKADTDFDSGNLGTIGGNIAEIIRNVGIVLAVVILMVLGIKYMVGSAEEKADYKKSMIPYLIGAVVLFGAAGIAQAVVSLSGNITTTN